MECSLCKRRDDSEYVIVGREDNGTMLCSRCHHYWHELPLEERVDFYKKYLNLENKVAKGNGSRYNDGKTPLDMVPETLIYAVAKVLEAGAKKYAKNNWRKGISISTQLGCLERHLSKFKSPHTSDFDKETGLHELMMVACNVAMILETMVAYPDLDDRFSYTDRSPMSTEQWLSHLGMVGQENKILSGSGITTQDLDDMAKEEEEKRKTVDLVKKI